MSLVLALSTAQTLLSTVIRFTTLSKQSNSSSLTNYSKMTRVEPIVLLDETLQDQPALSPILQTVNALFCTYYLQAVSLKTKVGDVDVVRLLEKFNPNREEIDFVGIGINKGLSGNFSFESAEYLLPKPRTSFESVDKVEQYPKLWQRTVSMESDDIPESEPKPEPKPEPSGNDVKGILNTRDSILTGQVSANLSVGTLLDVEIESNGVTRKIPVSVRLITTLVKPDVLLKILGGGTVDIELSERLHGVRSGRLSFIKDLIFCQDLIDDHKATLMTDKSGQYREILRRRTNNTARSLSTGVVSAATASNMVIMSATNFKRLEMQAGKRLHNSPVDRERLFASTYLMFLVVIDTMYNMVTIYTRGVPLPTTMSIREAEKQGKSNNMDISAMLKAMQGPNVRSLNII